MIGQIPDTDHERTVRWRFFKPIPENLRLLRQDYKLGQNCKTTDFRFGRCINSRR